MLAPAPVTLLPRGTVRFHSLTVHSKSDGRLRGCTASSFIPVHHSFQSLKGQCYISVTPAVGDGIRDGHLAPSQPIHWLPSTQASSPLEKPELIDSPSQRWSDLSQCWQPGWPIRKTKKQRKSPEGENASDTQRGTEARNMCPRRNGGRRFRFQMAFQALVWLK